MAKFFRLRFGETGDRLPIPDDTQPSGAVSYSEGFGIDYERDPIADPLAKNIPRDESNQLYYDITDGIRQYQTHGVPDFITTADNNGVAFSYDALAKVRFNDGSGVDIYTSLVNANNSLPSDATKWRKGEGGLTNLTGDVVANGPGSAVATIQANAITTAKILAQNVTLAKIAAQANNTILGNNSGTANSPSAIAIAASRLFGRGSSGNIGDIELSNDFAFLGQLLAISLNQSQGTNGFIRLPGGLILQWGQTPILAYTATIIVPYPIPFPNNVFSGIICSSASPSQPSGNNWFGVIDLATFRTNNPGVDTQKLYWFAIGN